MDAGVLALFLLAGFIGAVVSGIAGFAFGLVVSGVWLHIVAPAHGLNRDLTPVGLGRQHLRLDGHNQADRRALGTRSAWALQITS